MIGGVYLHENQMLYLLSVTALATYLVVEYVVLKSHFVTIIQNKLNVILILWYMIIIIIFLILQRSSSLHVELRCG